MFALRKCTPYVSIPHKVLNFRTEKFTSLSIWTPYLTHKIWSDVYIYIFFFSRIIILSSKFTYFHRRFHSIKQIFSLITETMRMLNQRGAFFMHLYKSCNLNIIFKQKKKVLWRLLLILRSMNQRNLKIFLLFVSV